MDLVALDAHGAGGAEFGDLGTSIIKCKGGSLAEFLRRNDHIVGLAYGKGALVRGECDFFNIAVIGVCVQFPGESEDSVHGAESVTLFIALEGNACYVCLPYLEFQEPEKVLEVEIQVLGVRSGGECLRVEIMGARSLVIHERELGMSVDHGVATVVRENAPVRCCSGDRGSMCERKRSPGLGVFGISIRSGIEKYVLRLFRVVSRENAQLIIGSPDNDRRVVGV